jgi:hypothetical protein
MLERKDKSYFEEKFSVKFNFLSEKGKEIFAKIYQAMQEATELDEFKNKKESQQENYIYSAGKNALNRVDVDEATRYKISKSKGEMNSLLDDASKDIYREYIQKQIKESKKKAQEKPTEKIEPLEQEKIKLEAMELAMKKFRELEESQEQPSSEPERNPNELKKASENFNNNLEQLLAQAEAQAKARTLPKLERLSGAQTQSINNNVNVGEVNHKQTLAMVNDNNLLIAFSQDDKDLFRLEQEGDNVFVKFPKALFEGLDIQSENGIAKLEVKPNDAKSPITLTSTNNSLTLNVESSDGTVKEYTLEVGPLGAKLSCEGKEYSFVAQNMDGSQAILNPTVSTGLVERLFSKNDSYVATKSLNMGTNGSGLRDAYLNQLVLLYANIKNNEKEEIKEQEFLQEFAITSNKAGQATSSISVLNIADANGDIQKYFLTKTNGKCYINLGAKDSAKQGSWAELKDYKRMFRDGVFSLVFQANKTQYSIPIGKIENWSSKSKQERTADLKDFKFDEARLKVFKSFEDFLGNPNITALQSTNSYGTLENFNFVVEDADSRDLHDFTPQEIKPITFNIASKPQAQEEQVDEKPQEQEDIEQPEETETPAGDGGDGNNGNDKKEQEEQPQNEEKALKPIVDNFTQTERETEEIDRTKRKFQETPADIMIIFGLALLLIAPLLGLGAVAAVVVSAVAVASTVGGMAYAASIDKLKNPLIKTYTRYLDPLTELEREIENQQEQFWEQEKNLDTAIENHAKVENEMAENVQTDPFYNEFIMQAIEDGMIPEVNSMEQFMDEQHMELRMDMLSDMRKMNSFGVTAEIQNEFVDKYFRTSSFDENNKLISKDILLNDEQRKKVMNGVKSFCPSASNFVNFAIANGAFPEIDPSKFSNAQELQKEYIKVYGANGNNKNAKIIEDIKKINDHSDQKDIDEIINKHFSNANSEIKAKLSEQLGAHARTKNTLDKLSQYNGSQAKVQQAKKANDEMIINGSEIFVKRILTGENLSENGKREATFNDAQILQMVEKHKNAIAQHYAFSAQHNPQVVDNFYSIFSENIHDQVCSLVADGVKDIESAQQRAYELGQYQKKRDIDNQQREAFAEAMNFTTKVMATENQPVCPTKQDIVNMTKQYAYASAVANLQDAESYFEKYGKFAGATENSLSQITDGAGTSMVGNDGDNGFIFGRKVFTTELMSVQSHAKGNNIQELLQKRNHLLEQTDFFESLSQQFNPTALKSNFSIVPFSAKLTEPILNFEREVEKYIRQVLISKVNSQVNKEMLSKLELDEILKNKEIMALTGDNLSDDNEIKTLISLHDANKNIEENIDKQVETLFKQLPKKTAELIKNKNFDPKDVKDYEKNVKNILKSNNMEVNAEQEKLLINLVTLSNDDTLSEDNSTKILTLANALANGEIRSYIKFNILSDSYMKEVKNLDELQTESEEDDFSAKEYAVSAKHGIENAYTQQNEFVQKIITPALEKFAPEICDKIKNDVKNGDVQNVKELQEKLIEHCKSSKRLDGRNLGEDAIKKMIESTKFSPDDPRLEEKLNSIISIVNNEVKKQDRNTPIFETDTQIFADIVLQVKANLKNDSSTKDMTPILRQAIFDKFKTMKNEIAMENLTYVNAFDKILTDEFLIACTTLDEKDIKKMIKGSEIAGLQDTTRNLRALEQKVTKESAKAHFRAGRETLKKSSTEQNISDKENKAITAYTKNSALQEMTDMINKVNKEFSAQNFQTGDEGILRDKLFELTKSEKFQACLKALNVDPKTFASSNKDFSLESFNASIGKMSNEKSVKSSKSEKAFKKVISKFSKNVTDKGKTNSTFVFRIKSKDVKEKDEDEKKKQLDEEKKKELERKKEQGFLNEEEKKAFEELLQNNEIPQIKTEKNENEDGKQ